MEEDTALHDLLSFVFFCYMENKVSLQMDIKDK